MYKMTIRSKMHATVLYLWICHKLVITYHICICDSSNITKICS
uniref:Uncharacterized protein n=1 Tax=Arundo donax TaxID=35708 RepID=A0A0A9F0H5_ARUDO